MNASASKVRFSTTAVICLVSALDGSAVEVQIRYALQQAYSVKECDSSLAVEHPRMQR